MKTRFWAKVIVLGEDDCWEWTACKWDGYGSFGTITPKVDRSHRVAWMLTHGDIPKGLCVLHKCDNRGCCNPKHLFLGTHEENQKDKVAKGRQHRPTKEGSPWYKCKKEDHPHFGRTGDKHPLFGKHHTEEAKLKMSEAQKARRQKDPAVGL